MKFKQLTKSLVLIALATFLIGKANAQSFHQATIEGMPDALPLNTISILELAKAPDSLLYRAASAFVEQDAWFWQRVGEYSQGNVSLVPDWHISLRPMLLNAPQPTAPVWARCPPKFTIVPDQAGIPPQQNFVLGYRRQQMISGCGTSPEAEAFTNAFIDRSMSMVRKVQSDTKKATQFALLLSVGFDYKKASIDLNSTDSSNKAVQHNTVDQTMTSTGKPYRGVQRVNDGVALPLQWGASMTRTAHVQACIRPLDLGRLRDRGLISQVDPTQVCFEFKGMQGSKIPTHVVIKDFSMLKPNDNPRLAIVFSTDGTIETDEDVGYVKQKIVYVKPAYAQMVDVNTAKTIGPKIPFDQSGALIYLRANECMKRVRGAWGAAEASAERGCISESLRAELAKIGAVSALQVPAATLDRLEAATKEAN